MKVLNLVQGSFEWLEARKQYFTASEAPAMMGESKYISRTQLLDHKKGWTTEVDQFTQKLFEKGHKSEQDALPLVEKLIGEELYPIVGILEGTKFLASFDGLTMMEDVIYEHKIFNKVLAENVLNDVLEPHYFWQLEQQLLVSGAEKVIFVTSDGTDNNWKHMFYESVPERREALIAGWAQFKKDLENHTPQAKTEKVIADSTIDLPTISYKMNGLALTSNLDEVEKAATELVAQSQQVLSTDQDFANAESRTKIFTKFEAACKEMAERVLSEAADIEKFTKDLGRISEMARQARLAEQKQIKTRKEELRQNIVNDAQAKVSEHSAIFSKLGVGAPLPTISIVDAMKNKRTLDSLKDAADTAISQIKIELDNAYRVVSDNAAFMQDYKDYKFLFSDWRDIAFKANDDFQSLVKLRIAEHKEAEEKKAVALREKIRAEEKAKVEREAQEKLDKEQAERAAEIKRQEQIKEQDELERERVELPAKDEPQHAPVTIKQEPQRADAVKRHLSRIEVNALLEFNTLMEVASKPDFSKQLSEKIHAYIKANTQGVA